MSFNRATYTVDLKHSLWSMDRGHWEEYAPDTWYEMMGYFRDGGCAEIHSSGRRLPYEGSAVVQIFKGRAWVDFHGQLGDREYHESGEVSAPTFKQLMHLIDHRELDLQRTLCAADHGRKGWNLQDLRCIKCGYPYRDKTSRYLA